MVGYVDRLEGDMAVVQWEDGDMENIPLSSIPFALGEGDGIQRCWDAYLPHDSGKRRREIRALEDELFQ